MDVEKEAREFALKHVASLVQRSDQLERIGELKKKSERKKAAVEAMLRTGVQSQLEGVRSAIAQLRSAADDIVTVESETNKIREKLRPFPALQQKMTALRECSERHEQYAAAIQNLQLIVNMHSVVAESKVAITNGKLLVVHKNIMDLENARDDLMYEVHKLDAPTMEKDKKSLLMFFKDVDDLVNALWREMVSFLKRCMTLLRNNNQGPTTIVSIMRIIEREERIDRYYIERRIPMNGFMPPERPRRWREKAMLHIDEAVWERVSASQIEDDRAATTAWLARYLECIRLTVTDDLNQAKKTSGSCFPSEYQMYDNFVAMFHAAVQRRLRELIESDSGLQKAEIVQLLKWIKDYTGEDMLGDRRLGLNAAAIVAEDPLLPPDVMVQLQEKFLVMTREDMTMWLARTLDQEKDDWYKNVHPEEDADGNFYTPLPSILFGMLEDTILLAKEFSMDVLPHVIDMAMQEFLPFVGKYKEAAMAFKLKHFEDRNRFNQFTSTIIAVANNMMSCAELTEKYQRQIRLSMEEETNGGRGGMRRQNVIDDITKVVNAWHSGSTSMTAILLEEVNMDIKQHLADVFTRKWLDGTANPQGVIVETLRDYHTDHKHLKSAILLYLAQRVHSRVVGEYLRSIESRRLTFAALSERQQAATVLRNDAKAIERAFNMYVPPEEQSQFTPLQTILLSIADVLSLTDKSLIELEITNFTRKFPNCPPDVLAALLLAREDVGRAEAKEMAERSLSHTMHHPRDVAFGELFESARADAPSWMMAAGGTRVADVHAATSKLASMLKRVGNE